VKDSVERVAVFVHELLKHRRPRRFAVDPEDGGALLAAAALAAAEPGSDAPSPQFVERLHRQLADAANQSTQPSSSRRRLLRRLGMPAIAALLGAGAATVVRSTLPRLEPSENELELVPSGAASWMPVASLASLTPGVPARFSAGAVQGFLTLTPNPGTGPVVATVSAVCTHMGCLLNPNADDARLDCPCHGASFRLDGAPLSELYTEPLPRIPVRVRGDVVEVYAAG
jgi:Rieske Fe-S protein